MDSARLIEYSRELCSPFGIDVYLVCDVGDGGEQVIGGIVAENARQRLVYGEESPVRRRLEDPEDGLLEYPAIPLLRVTKRLLTAFATDRKRDVAGYRLREADLGS